MYILYYYIWIAKITNAFELDANNVNFVYYGEAPNLA